MRVSAGFLWEDAVQARAGDDSIWLNDDLLVGRAAMVQRFLNGDRGNFARDWRSAGCHGMPMIKTWLPYVDLSTLFQIPVAHCVLYGLVKDFFSLILAPFPTGEMHNG